MKQELLTILRCPLCSASFSLSATASDEREVRTGQITCWGADQHRFSIQNGILHLATGFNHEAVKKELEYENSTYKGSDQLTNPDIIAHFPDTLADLWPHTCNFGPDFRVLIDQLQIKPNAWVLDVGTGPCWSSRLLAQTGANVIALDVNEANFYGLGTGDLLFKTHNVFFERILESMTNLPFKDDSLDYIAFNASFHHTPDHCSTLNECFRVLKPGGIAAMVNEEFTSVRHRFSHTDSLTDTGSHHAIPYAEFERSAESVGFRIRYFVADHVRKSLEQKLSPALGTMVVKTMERFPISLKQLNSALVLLTKPESVPAL